MALAPIETKDIAVWVDFIRSTDILVLKQTAREITRLQEDEDKLSAVPLLLWC